MGSFQLGIGLFLDGGGLGVRMGGCVLAGRPVLIPPTKRSYCLIGGGHMGCRRKTVEGGSQPSTKGCFQSAGEMGELMEASVVVGSARVGRPRGIRLWLLREVMVGER